MASAMAKATHEGDDIELPRASIPGRDHQPRGLASLRFSLSFRDDEDLLAGQGIEFSYETIRQRSAQIGRLEAKLTIPKGGP